MPKKHYAVLIRIAAVIVVGLVSNAVAARVKAANQAHPSHRSDNRSGNDEDVANWIAYDWNGFRFKYPANWKVEPQYYRTPPEEAEGKPAYEIGLTLLPQGESRRGNRSIGIGGRQASCESFIASCKCFTMYVAVSTCSSDAETLRIFDLFLKTIRNSNPNEAFHITTPKAQERLLHNAHYKIGWRTKPQLRIRAVNIYVYDTSGKWSKGRPILVVKDVPNTGSYDWIVPDSVGSSGPYLLEISFVKPVKATPPALSSGRIYDGRSDPFYIY